MGLFKLTWVFLVFWVFATLCSIAHSAAPLYSLKLFKAPHAFSHLSSATFVFDVLLGGNGESCRNCSLSCKLDDGLPSDCVDRKVSYSGLQDGNHIFEVCSNGSYGVGCSSFNWTVDTVPPTAYVTAPTSFTNALNFSVNISFSEPCGRGFGCSSVNACNLLAYGPGQVIPSSLQILEPNLRYSLLVSLSSTVQYGRVILVMDKDFCTDTAGNGFSRTDNSSFFVHFDRRDVSTNLKIRIPERLVQLNSAIRTVQATNDYSDLKVYLNFSEPVLNSSTEVLSTLTVSQGSLVPTSGKTHGNRRFGFLVENVPGIAIITVNLDSTSIISRQGTPVSPIAPLTFLYDSQRPIARLSTTANMRTKEHTIPISVKFTKPVFGFNSSYLLISGGHLQNFREVSTSIYTVEIRADNEFISINVPENATGDVAGNKNLPSNTLQVRHYSVPKIAFVVAIFATVAFVATSFVAGLLTISTASLQSVGAFSRSTLLLTNPARNLFRIAFYIQVFALSRWLAVTLPVEYYEFARGLQWSIPYFHLPWECDHIQPVMVGSSTPSVSVHSYMSEIHGLGVLQGVRPTEENISKAASLYGLPLTPTEYRMFFESQNMKPEAEFISDPKSSNGWRDFARSMFWLAVIAGSLILLHALVLFILQFRKKSSEKKKDYGTLTFPRFEIFLIILALPCISEASASLIRGGGASGIIVGILFLGFVAFVLLALLLFLTVGITFGKLLQYKEVHQEGQKFHWYQDIVRVTLGPGKRGQWTWKNQTSSVYLIIFGPLFEDLRGPPKYMLTQISGSNPHKNSDSIIASEDETEDAEAPFIQKLFGILRIYYTVLEHVKRVTLGIVAGAYMDDWSSRTPTIALLSITSFQLFFLVLKKPLIKKKVQLVEIIAILCEVGLFGTCLVLLEKGLSEKCETKVGIFMLTLFLIGFLPQLVNEWYALFRQTKRLDPADKSFSTGLKVGLIGILVFLIPEKFTKRLESALPVNLHWNRGLVDPSSSAERQGSSESRSSGATERWLKQLRELAKASFSKEGSGGSATDPSGSRTARWSEFWSKRSGSSSLKSSTDLKAKPRKRLEKDLEDIFASK